MKCGGVLYGVCVVYEIWGMFNVVCDNVVLIFIGLLFSVYVVLNLDDFLFGWWEVMFGFGKVIDSDCWFVICVNLLGSDKGFICFVLIDLVIG